MAEPQEPHHDGRHPPRLPAEEVLDLGRRGGRRGRGHIFISRTSRTSTLPLSRSKIGQPRASSVAASRLAAVTMRYPPTRSFVSPNGPSVTAFFFPETTRPPSARGSP